MERSMSVARVTALCGLAVMIGGFYLPAPGSGNHWEALESSSHVIIGLGVAAFVAAAMRPPWLRMPGFLPAWTMAALLAVIGGVLAFAVAIAVAGADGIRGLWVTVAGAITVLGGSIAELVAESPMGPQHGGNTAVEGLDDVGLPAATDQIPAFVEEAPAATESDEQGDPEPDETATSDRGPGAGDGPADELSSPG